MSSFFCFEQASRNEYCRNENCRNEYCRNEKVILEREKRSMFYYYYYYYYHNHHSHNHHRIPQASFQKEYFFCIEIPGQKNVRSIHLSVYFYLSLYLYLSLSLYLYLSIYLSSPKKTPAEQQQQRGLDLI